MTHLTSPYAAPTIIYDTATGPIEARLCPGCGLPERLWKEDGGRGHVTADGDSYCCRGCAEQTGCTCV